MTTISKEAIENLVQSGAHGNSEASVSSNISTITRQTAKTMPTWQDLKIYDATFYPINLMKFIKMVQREKKKTSSGMARISLTLIDCIIIGDAADVLPYLFGAHLFSIRFLRCVTRNALSRRATYLEAFSHNADMILSNNSLEELVVHSVFNRQIWTNVAKFAIRGNTRLKRLHGPIPQNDFPADFNVLHEGI